MIELDGSYGEGGGQIVRTALALSTLTSKPFHVTNIRRGREAPGLKAQHLHGITALQHLCAAKAEGATLGSAELTFYPGAYKAKTLSIDIGTAGSITLLLQSILLPCIFADKTISLGIKGGTDVAWSMPIDYLANVFLPHLQPFATLTCQTIKRGYYPKGGGEVMLKIKPALSRNRFESFDSFWNATRAHHQLHLVEQGKLIAIKGVSHASALLEEKQVAERQAAAAKSSLVSLGVPTDIRVEYNQTLSPGSGITLWAIFSKRGDDIDERFPIRLGADALGERGKPAEIVGEEAAKHLLEDIKSRAPVDEHLADNLIPLLALCAPSAMKTVRISPHCLTNIFVVEQFLGKLFSVEKNTIRSRLPT